MKQEYFGVLTGYFETGMEGILCALQRDGLKGYEGLVILKNGDYLEIASMDGKTVFNDIIKH